MDCCERTEGQSLDFMIHDSIPVRLGNGLPVLTECIVVKETDTRHHERANGCLGNGKTVSVLPVS